MPYNIVAIALLLTVLATGCGYKGDLYLPDDSAVQQRDQEKSKKPSK